MDRSETLRVAKAEEELIMRCILKILINHHCSVSIIMLLHIHKDKAQIAINNITNQSTT